MISKLDVFFKFVHLDHFLASDFFGSLTPFVTPQLCFAKNSPLDFVRD